MNAFVKLTCADDGYSTFSMFGSSGGTAKFLINDTNKKKYVGLFQSNEPLPEDNEWFLDVDEYLTVTEGEITIEFVPSGEVVTIGAGELGFIPSGSRIRLTLSKLPYAETFVMIAPES